ncbi:hypothetical protein Phum_PHUM417640 [Pediculus humanus corporis]|uniref:Uncharacterized protein n=1 Tax=Pediculus humanus subsp. corporis TaxID=121224 RepID=E0VSF0_PEDHC|nr:uncharacterized protein Phum_PHUM417640 [Pediculus humanus corporis]EEB16306.1 hypothetical protein Phum_PHUM417640 [Pediculus humanus corporis]
MRNETVMTNLNDYTTVRNHQIASKEVVDKNKNDVYEGRSLENGSHMENVNSNTMKKIRVSSNERTQTNNRGYETFRDQPTKIVTVGKGGGGGHNKTETTIFPFGRKSTPISNVQSLKNSIKFGPTGQTDWVPIVPDKLTQRQMMSNKPQEHYHHNNKQVTQSVVFVQKKNKTTMDKQHSSIVFPSDDVDMLESDFQLKNVEIQKTTTSTSTRRNDVEKKSSTDESLNLNKMDLNKSPIKFQGPVEYKKSNRTGDNSKSDNNNNNGEKNSSEMAIPATGVSWTLATLRVPVSSKSTEKPGGITETNLPNFQNSSANLTEKFPQNTIVVVPPENTKMENVTKEPNVVTNSTPHVNLNYNSMMTPVLNASSTITEAFSFTKSYSNVTSPVVSHDKTWSTLKIVNPTHEFSKASENITQTSTPQMNDDEGSSADTGTPTTTEIFNNFNTVPDNWSNLSSSSTTPDVEITSIGYNDTKNSEEVVPLSIAPEDITSQTVASATTDKTTDYFTSATTSELEETTLPSSSTKIGSFEDIDVDEGEIGSTETEYKSTTTDTTIKTDEKSTLTSSGDTLPREESNNNNNNVDETTTKTILFPKTRPTTESSFFNLGQMNESSSTPSSSSPSSSSPSSPSPFNNNKTVLSKEKPFTDNSIHSTTESDREKNIFQIFSTELPTRGITLADVVTPPTIVGNDNKTKTTITTTDTYATPSSILTTAIPPIVSTTTTTFTTTKYGTSPSERTTPTLSTATTTTFTQSTTATTPTTPLPPVTESKQPKTTEESIYYQNYIPTTYNPFDEITEENVPAYLRLTVQTSSWMELCSLKEPLRGAILKMLNGRNVTSDSIHFLNLSDRHCLEKIEETRRKESNRTVFLPVNMFLMDKNRDFDKNLSEAFLTLWGRHGLDFDLPVS